MAGSNRGHEIEIKKTPQSTYSGKIVVDPVTRIEGHLAIEVEVENGKIKDARSTATLFRGIEMILKGRDPRDAQHFTQRACGVCTFTHALASTRAVENAVGVTIPQNANHIRNLVLGAHIMHDHIVHFYGLHALDFVDVTSALRADVSKAAKLVTDLKPADLQAVQERLKNFVGTGQLGPFAKSYALGGHEAYYLSPEENLVTVAHYIEALRIQAELARAVAAFGAKHPHPQFTVVGGVTSYQSLTKERIEEFRKIIKKGVNFVNTSYKNDLLLIASNYKDWSLFGGCDNYISTDEFRSDASDKSTAYFSEGVIFNRNLKGVQALNRDKITEHVRHSWYKGDAAAHPLQGVTDPLFTGEDAGTDRYSWSKAPRYASQAMETGPLAQVLNSYAKGHPEVTKQVDSILKHLGAETSALFSTLGRTAARFVHTSVIANKLESWLNDFEANVKTGDSELVTPWEMPSSAEGVGFVDAPRGALSHWITIENSVIKNFQMVVPTTWNFGPRCGLGKLGPIEQALIGTPIADPKRPVEILRTIHSFDPCMACAVHVIDPISNEKNVFKIL